MTTHTFTTETIVKQLAIYGYRTDLMNQIISEINQEIAALEDANKDDEAERMTETKLATAESVKGAHFSSSQGILDLCNAAGINTSSLIRRAESLVWRMRVNAENTPGIDIETSVEQAWDDYQNEGK